MLLLLLLLLLSGILASRYSPAHCPATAVSRDLQLCSQCASNEPVVEQDALLLRVSLKAGSSEVCPWPD